MTAADPKGANGARPIFFLTDFGYEDEFTGVCRAVIESVAPGVRVLDLTHGIEPGDVRRGALALAAAIPYSATAVWLAVVDPGVGTARRALVVRAGEHLLVGPDNGLLWPACEAAGGAAAAWEISNSPARLEGGQRTFHGRDLFSPVAAHLAAGRDPEDLGVSTDPAGIERLELPVARVSQSRIEATVLIRDRYGNLILDVTSGQAGDSFLKPGDPVVVRLPDGSRATIPFAGAFGEVDPGEALVYPDSSGRLAIAVNRGDASAAFDAGPGDEIVLTAT